jgi:murein DD-endopeptidase MepM/ murein hydrolase activator NlpD
VIFLIDYFSVAGIRLKYKNLIDENIRQNQKIAEYKVSFNKLRDSVDNFKNYAQKLNVMAGLKSPEALKEIGIGNGRSDLSEKSAVNNFQDITFSNIRNISSKADGIEKNLSTLMKFFEAQSTRLAFTPSIAPARGYLASAFGWRDDPFTGKRTFHYGIDIATQTGNPIAATADGIVVATKREKIGGKTIILSHRFGYQTVYCHLSKFLVRPGQKVKRGDVIGLIGRTGKALGPHVHYEVRVNNKEVNPFYYILEE